MGGKIKITDALLNYQIGERETSLLPSSPGRRLALLEMGRDCYDSEERQLWNFVDFGSHSSNWTSTGSEFVNFA